MRIVFGWNSFKLRSFPFPDLGVTQNEEAGATIEVRQKYFHLFYIPFFSLGKQWAVRKDGQLYEMPGELQTLVKRSATTETIKTPFYTYAGLLLLAAGLIIYQINVSIDEHKSIQQETVVFNEEKAQLETKLQHLTTKDFISVQRLGNRYDFMDTTVYLKVEDIKGDNITVTPVEPHYEGSFAMAWEVEDEYTRNAGTLPSVKTSYKQIMAAVIKDYDTKNNIKDLNSQGVTLLNNGRKYVVTNVVRHFGPIITARRTGSFGGTKLGLDFENVGWPATISDVQEMTGNGDWSQNINQEVDARDFMTPAFTLRATNCKAGKPYLIHLTLKDTIGQLHKYEITGANMKYSVMPL